MGIKILNTIGDGYTKSAKTILENVGSVDYVIPSQNELKEKIGGYDIAVIGLGLMFDKEVLAQAKNLKIIATATTGLDHVDIEYAKEKGIEVLSLRGETEFLDTITGTAELAAGLMIDLLRLTPHAFESVKNYEWDREQFRGHNLYGRTLGIVGMGRLGRWMARYGNAFGMNILYTDSNIWKSDFQILKSDFQNFQMVEFDELLGKSDVVSIHVHLGDETKNMFDEEVFEKMKNSAYLINTARGGIVDEDALLKALKNSEITGYATDVLADELGFNKEFSKHPLVEYAKQNRNVIIVPHIGGMTVESRECTDIFIAEKIRKFLNKKITLE